MGQNVSNEFLLAWFKFQVKIPSRSGVYVQGERQKYTPLFPPLSKDEWLRDIGHSISTGNLILGVNSVAVSYIIHYDSLLQNATDVITNCDDFNTECNSYYKMQCLLQIATVQR